MKITVAIADDHVLLRSALANLINGFGDCEVLHESGNGVELGQKLQAGAVPHIVLLDLNMPLMDGFETAQWLKDHFPQVLVVMLTMYDSEITLIKLLEAGVKGFLKKDVHPADLHAALRSVKEKGFYYSNNTAGQLANLFRPAGADKLRHEAVHLSRQELRFMQLACSDLTYKEIAEQMNLSPRTIDGLRDALFLRFGVKSRVGLAMIAIRNGMAR